MSTGSLTHPGDTANPRRIAYVEAHDIWASLVGGGSVSVEEWPQGKLQRLMREDTGDALLVEIAEDVVAGTPMDRVSVHPDEDNRLALIRRGIQALKNAEAALMERGFVDRDERERTPSS